MKYLVIGSNGQLGREFMKNLTKVGADVTGMEVDEINITELSSVSQVIEGIKPNFVINCAAYNNVDEAELKPEKAIKVNAIGVGNLVSVCLKNGLFLVHFSTDYVFDGQKVGSPYKEDEKTAPINKYGLSKFAGESHLPFLGDKYLLFRVSWLYGDGEQNFIRKLLEWSEKNKTLKIASDEVSVPTYTGTVVAATINALSTGISGLYHFVNSGQASRYEWAEKILEYSGRKNKLQKVSKDIFNLPARRPDYSAMDNEYISRLLEISIPDWEWDLKKYINT